MWGLSQVPVLYPFGHGLSYCSFVYSTLQARQSCSAQDPCLEITSRVRNTGIAASWRVPAAYMASCSVCCMQSHLRSCQRGQPLMSVWT